MALLQLENVSFSYDKRTDVVKNVSLSVSEGEYIAIIGHNGSGKSTLARIFNGLLKADSGKVTVDGMDPTDKKSMFDVRRTVGVVFQNPDNQLVASIVEDDVVFGPENLGIKREEIEKRLNFALSSVGMEEYRHSSPTRLSGGQKQRIAIAGVLALNPKILVLDESTAMLDPQGRREVLDVINKLNKKNNTTIITITHYMEEVVEADRVFVMNDGRIAEEGTPKEIFALKDKINDYGLEMPFSSVIAESLRKKGVALPEGILTEKELAEELCKLKQKI